MYNNIDVYIEYNRKIVYVTWDMYELKYFKYRF